MGTVVSQRNRIRNRLVIRGITNRDTLKSDFVIIIQDNLLFEIQ